jgi:hypothetical protein
MDKVGGLLAFAEMSTFVDKERDDGVRRGIDKRPVQDYYRTAESTNSLD